MPRTRRDALRLAGGALPLLLAGCTGGSGGGDAPTQTQTQTRTRTRTATRTATRTGTASVDVSDVTVVPSLTALTTPDSIGTVGARDEQFVLATVASGNEGPDRSAFSLSVGDETYAPVDPQSSAGYRSVWHAGGIAYPYEPGSEGFVHFRVPKPLDAGSAAIEWPGGEQALPASAVERLARPPTTFEVRDFSAPDSVAVGETATVSLTVANVGDAAGTFVGAVNRIGPRIAYTPAARAAPQVPAGETATWTHEYQPSADAADVESPTAEFKLNWRNGEESVTVAVVPSGTTTS